LQPTERVLLSVGAFENYSVIFILLLIKDNELKTYSSAPIAAKPC
jgi:hypothetical protein